MVRWLGDRAEELGVNLFAGFPVDALLVEGNRSAVYAPRRSGLDRQREATPQVPSRPTSPRRLRWWPRVRGVCCRRRTVSGRRSASPILSSMRSGVKEVWETKRPLDRVIHTLGWPLPTDAFGGSFMYPLGPTQVALGLVVGLDYHDAALDVHELLQRMKLHPLFRPQLEGGQLLEWGAKTIPEGGYYSLPDRRHGDGILLIGDAAGFVDVPSLKGIHYAMQSGIFAARTALAALKSQATFRSRGLAPYDRMVDGAT